MKRNNSCILALTALLPALLTPASANSAPTHWEGSPGSEVLAVEEDCPIAVAHEDLSFQVIGPSSYSLAARVEAVYQMENPTPEAQSVQMAFSLEEAVRDFDLNTVTVTAGGEVLPFSLVWDGVAPEHQPTRFDPNRIGKLYSFTLAAPPENSENTLTLSVPEGLAWLDYDGINSYSGGEDGTITLSARRSAAHVRLYALEGDLNYTVSGDYGLLTSETPFSQYFQGYLEDCYGWCDASLTALKYQQLEQAWQNSPVAIAEWVEANDYSRIPLQLVYTVDFPPESAVEVAVSYQTESDGLREGTAGWQHTFEYLLSPARHWASFGTLDIHVDAGESGYPYVIASSLPLERQADGTYAAHSESLPEEDLFFTLYDAPELSLSDRVTAALGITTYTLAFLRLLAVPVGILLALLAVFFLRRRRQKKGR